MRIILASLFPPFLRLISSPFGRTFLISLAIWLLVFSYCRHAFWRDPHSAFFQSEHVYEWKYTSFRRTQARSFLSSLSTQNEPAIKAGPKPKICAAFVTVKRDGEQYVDTAIGSLLEGLTQLERDRLYLAVLFADPEPSVHPSWTQPWLEKAVDWKGTYNVSSETHHQLKAWMEIHDFYHKGVFDYLYALNLCYETKAPYILMLEDDIILADAWLAKTSQALREIETKSAFPTDPYFNWLYLRIFWTETSMRWREEVDFWFRRMDLLIAIGSLCTFGVTLGVRRWTRANKWLDHYAIAVLCLVTTPAFIMLTFMIGKYSLFPPRGVFVMNRYGCCSQALIFPRTQVEGMKNWFQEKGRQMVSTDVMIDAYADEKGFERLSYAPQLVQHVGLRSSRDGKEVDSRSTRAFWFDEMDPVRLRREHDILTGA